MSAEVKEPPSGDSQPHGKEQDAELSAVNNAVLGAVVERLYFFFSDANIRQDKFIRNLLMDKDQTVPIESLLKFNTIKQHTTDANVVVQAAKSEKLQDRLKLTDDSKGIQLIQPFTKDRMREHIPLTLVVDNLPLKEEDNKILYAVTIEEIRALFEQYGEVALVKFRFGFKHDEKDKSNTETDKKTDASPQKQRKTRVPMGSAFVEFADQETLVKAAADVLTKKEDKDVEPKRKLELGGKELSVVGMKEHFDKTGNDKGDRKRKSSGGDPKDGDDNDEKDDEQSEEEKEEEVTFELEWKPGCVIKMEGLPESCDREALLDSVSKSLGKPVDDIKALKIYVDFSRGQTHGAIRFQSPEDGVQQVLDKIKSGEVKIADQTVDNVVILDSNEEKKYWHDFIEFKKKQIRQKRSSRNSGGSRRKKKRRSG